jgi:hypothetical protein
MVAYIGFDEFRDVRNAPIFDLNLPYFRCNVRRYRQVPCIDFDQPRTLSIPANRPDPFPARCCAQLLGNRFSDAGMEGFSNRCAISVIPSSLNIFLEQVAIDLGRHDFKVIAANHSTRTNQSRRISYICANSPVAMIAIDVDQVKRGFKQTRQDFLGRTNRYINKSRNASRGYVVFEQTLNQSVPGSGTHLIMNFISIDRQVEIRAPNIDACYAPGAPDFLKGLCPGYGRCACPAANLEQLGRPAVF